MRIQRHLFVVLLLVPSAARPQGSPVGSEFRVNTYTTSNQRLPSVARAASGDFVVVWASQQDGAGDGVFGQRYAASGVPLGSEFRANTYTTNSQGFPAVAADPAGNFVVVWQSYQQDGSVYGIFGQRYAATGTPLGTEFRVNTSTTNTQVLPAVAADASGNFVVAWQSGPTSATLFAQRFASSGIPLGPEFRVNTSAYSAEKPSIASDASGNVVVVWQLQSFGNGISGQRYSSSGTPLGSEFFVVDPCLRCAGRTPSVASDSAGNFVVVWDTGPNYGAGGDISAQRYSSSGAPLNTFLVNTYLTNYQTEPAIAADASGNFVVVWTSAGQDGSYGGVFGQRFLSSGAPLGPEFRVNTHTSQAQNAPAVATDPLGNFVVSWSSNVQDGSAYGIFGQRYNMIVPVELMHFRVE